MLQFLYHVFWGTVRRSVLNFFAKKVRVLVHLARGDQPILSKFGQIFFILFLFWTTCFQRKYSVQLNMVCRCLISPKMVLWCIVKYLLHIIWIFTIVCEILPIKDYLYNAHMSKMALSSRLPRLCTSQWAFCFIEHNWFH